MESEYKRILVEITELLGNKIDDSKVNILEKKHPHKTNSLPNDKMAIYIFRFNDEYLKIGKVGPNSNARFTSQHYNPNSCRSNLAKSLINDKKFQIENNIILDENNIKNWMFDNLDRIDIILDKSLGIYTLDLFEMCLHYKFKPRYEGFSNQDYLGI